MRARSAAPPYRGPNDALLRRHGTDFAEISKFVGTRTSTQVRTHVQKYHLKLVRPAACIGQMRRVPAATLGVYLRPLTRATRGHQVREYQASKRKASEAAAAAAEEDAQKYARF